MDHVNKYAEVDRWKEYFDSTGKDVFEIIYLAIKVAYRFRPAGLLQHRCNLAQHLFSGFKDNGNSDFDFEESTEDSQVIQPKDKVEANQGRKLRIKLKLPTGVVLSSNPKQEEEINKVSEDIPKITPELDTNEKHRYISTMKSKSQEEAEAKTKNRLNELIKDPKISSTNNELSMQNEKATSCVETKMKEGEREAMKRRTEDRYKEFENARKKIRKEDLKYTPKPMKLIGGCGKSFRRRPVIYHIRRTET